MTIKYVAHVIQYFKESYNNILPIGKTPRYNRPGRGKIFYGCTTKPKRIKKNTTTKDFVIKHSKSRCFPFGLQIKNEKNKKRGRGAL